MGNYLLSLRPTFAQGFILGQISILFLLALILKYLFWSSGPEPQVVSLPPRTEKINPLDSAHSPSPPPEGDESLEWINAILLKIVQSYKEQFREYLSNSEAQELVRKKIEDKLNSSRPAAFLDPFKVHAVDVGSRAPRLLKASLVDNDGLGTPSSCQFQVSYRDSVSISLSTSILLHFPRPYFARLPVALSLSLADFSARLVVIPPQPSSLKQSLTFALQPDFTLNFETNSLIGSRAKLADVPKIHDVIESQIRRFLVQHGTWTIVLPPLDPEQHIGSPDGGEL